MSLSKPSKRPRIRLSSFIVLIFFVCIIEVWGIRELLFPATDVCAIEQSEGKNLLDISQVYPIEDNVELIGHVGGEAESVFVRGGRAFVKFGLELAVLDIRNPSRPKRLGYILISGDLIHVDVNGNFAYIYASNDRLGLWKVDMSEPAQMSIDHIYNPINFSQITSIRLLDEQAYITTRTCESIYLFLDNVQTRCDNTLHVVDTNNLDSPVKCYRGFWGNVIQTSAVSDAPELINGSKTARQGNYLYSAEGKDGLKVYDVSDPIHRVEIGFYSPVNKISNLFSFGTHVYASISEEQGVDMRVKHMLHVFDVISPNEPIDLGELSIKPIMLANLNNYVFLRDYPSAGLEILDMSLPITEGVFTAPEQLSDIVNMTIVGNRAYATTSDSRFLILDVTKMEHPSIVADQYVVARDQRIDHLTVAGKYAYIIVRDVGMKILDVADENNIIEVGYYSGFYTGIELAVKDNFVYVGEQFGGFQIVDVSNPSQPIQIGEYELRSQVSKMQIVKNYLFMSAYDSGILILDITNPTIPSLAGSFVTGSTILSMDVGCQYIYVTDRAFGLFILKSDLMTTEDCG